VYVQNRIPCNKAAQTPFELWFAYKPDVSLLRVFGCLCYVYIPMKLGASKTKRQKLDFRSVRGIFVGYAPQQRGWRVLDCTSGKILTSIHVTFDETGSAAADELKRGELTKLAAHQQFDFDYFTRSAVTPSELLFYEDSSTKVVNSPTELSLLEDFVNEFDLQSVHLATIESALTCYAPRAYSVIHERVQRTPIESGPQVLTSRDPVLRLTRAQLEAEALVAVENIDHKQSLDRGVAEAFRQEPSSYAEAMLSEDKDKWEEAIASEIQSLEENETWTTVDLPPGKKALTSRWIFRLKKDMFGAITKYKARLVIRGFLQQAGIDYDEIFAPVVRMEALRVLLALVCIEDLEAHAMDIHTAFLNGTVEEDIYMVIPEGMINKMNRGKVFKLLKSLYGLKQAPRAWHKALTAFLRSIGFEKLMCESCIYQRIHNGKRQIIAIYVDDLLIITKSTSEMVELKQMIAAKFKSTDQGPVEFLLGLKITRDRERRKMWISQEANVNEIIKKFNLSHCKPSKTPVANGNKLKSTKGKELSTEMKSKPFRQAVGTLMYLMIGSRPDLVFAIANVSLHLSSYEKEHWEAVKRVLRYVKGTGSHGLEYGGDSVKLSAYTDSDYAGDVASRKSTSGYVTFVGDCAVTWSARKQRIVATSTAEAEYIALAHCAREVLFLRQFLKELGYPQEPTVIREDNQACITIAENPAHHARTKHIDVRYHFIRERIELGQIKLEFVGSKENVADIFTKGLDQDLFCKNQERLGIIAVKK